MVSEPQMTVEVAYARPDEQRIVVLSVPRRCTVQLAIEQSGLLHSYPEIDLAQHKVGIFGKLSQLKAQMHPGDRAEIYRPLIADPKEARKKRAAQGKPMKKGT